MTKNLFERKINSKEHFLDKNNNIIKIINLIKSASNLNR